MLFPSPLLGLLLGCSLTPIPSSAAFAPNIIFVLADDLGWSDVDWRDRRLATPTLRQLAFSPHSVQLTNAYVTPLCTSTRSAMLSGLYPFRTGTQAGVFLHADAGGLPTDVRLLPELLRQRGYRTHLVGKWHLGYCRREFLPTARGFDSFYGYYGPQEGYYNHSTDMFDRAQGVLLQGLDLFRESAAKSEPDWAQEGIYSTDLFVDEAIRAISTLSPRPFFLLLSFQSVHAPLQLPPDPTSLLAHCSPSLPANRRIYCAMLASMDAAIGRLLAHLRRSGLYERSILVFGTDVGEWMNPAGERHFAQNGGDAAFGASNAPLRGGKGTLWEGGTRTTAIVHSPRHIGQFAARTGLFHAVDWPATLLGASGVNVSRLGDGLNQWPMIVDGANAASRAELLYALDPGGRGSAIRDRQFKLVLRPGFRPALFHLALDQSEQRDLALLRPKLVRRMRAKLAEREGGRRTGNVMKMRTDPRGWPQRHGGVFAGEWC